MSVEDVQKRNDAMRAVLAVTSLEDWDIPTVLRQKLKAVGITGGKEDITDDQLAQFFESWTFPSDPYALLLEDTQRQSTEGINKIEAPAVDGSVKAMVERVSGVTEGAPAGETIH